MFKLKVYLSASVSAKPKDATLGERLVLVPVRFSELSDIMACNIATYIYKGQEVHWRK